MAIRLQEAAFDPGGETNAFIADCGSAGAAVTFTGLVRSAPDDPVKTLTLECYEDLAQSQIAQMAAEAIVRFDLLKVSVIHRYGALQPGEPIVQVMTLAPHREAAFKGAEFLMDYLKTGAPFWKKETTPTGERWVEATTEDDSAKARWRQRAIDDGRPFALERLDHVTLLVSSMTRALHFYVEIIGCQPEASSPQYGMEFLSCGSGHIVLVDITKPSAEWARPPVSGGRNMDHVCLAISPYEPDKMRRHLARNEIEIVEETYHGKYLSFYVRDPFGNQLELRGLPKS